jgi:hypothetical protein
MGDIFGPTFVITALTLAAAAVIGFFFFRTQYRTLMAITPANRLMAPGLVWLQFIPFFAMIWQFVVIVQIARSLRKERVFRMEESLLSDSLAPQLPSAAYPTLALGLAYCILSFGITFFNLFGTFNPDPTAILTPLITLGSIAAAFICWIVYWVKLGSIRTELRRTAAIL